MERRVHPRVPFQHPADLQLENTRFPGQIRDFCPGGVLFELAPQPNDESSVLSEGSALDLEITCEYKGRTLRLRMQGEARHLQGSMLGVRFLQVDQQALSILEELSGYSAKAAESGSTPSSDSRTAIAKPELASAFVQLLQESMPVAIEHALSEAGSRLMESADAAVDGWLRSDFSISMQILDSKGHWLADGVTQEVVAQLRGDSGNGSGFETSASRPRLSLVGKDDFEDWLAMNMAVKAIENELEQDLLRLVAAFSQVLGKKFSMENLPVGASVILRCFRHACNALDLPASSHPILYKCLGMVLQHELRDIYGSMISLVERAGISTQIEAPSRPAQPPPRRKAARGIARSAGHGAADVSATDQQAVFADGNTLQTLQSLMRLRAEPSTKSEPEAQTQTELQGRAEVVTDDVISVLEALQREQSNVEEGSWQHNIQGRLSERESHAVLPAEDAELIQITDRLFGALFGQLKDNNALANNNALAKWLERLKLSVLKVVLLDHTFFTDDQHPARQMINMMARLGGGELGQNQSLDRSLDGFVNRVVDEYNGDNSLFEDILSQLNKLVQRQERAFQRNAERVARTYEGQQRLFRARRRVKAELDVRLAEKLVPMLLLDLLEKAGWRQFLVITCLRQGHNSAEFKDFLTVIDSLMAWLAEDETARLQLEQQIEKDIEAPAMLDMVEHQLADSGQAGYQQTLDQIRRCLQGDEKAEFTQIDSYPWPEEEPLGEKEVIRRPASTRWHKRIQQLQIGNWVMLQAPGEPPRRMRLAWSGTDSYRFVFVNSQGMKDVDLSLDELADRLKEGHLQVMDEAEVPLIDKGLHEMVQSVYEDFAAQSSCDPLTGLFNRQEFERNIERVLASGPVKSGQLHAMAYLDLDKFKVINNTYGHVAGDQLLKYVAEQMRGGKAHNVSFGRLGGNEFGILMLDTSLDEIEQRVKAFQGLLEKAPYQWQESTIAVTLSAGITAIDPVVDTVDTVLRKVHVACDKSKQSGHSRVTVYTSDDQEQVRRDEMLNWVRKIDTDLDDILVLRCQEIRPLSQDSDALPHYEILLGVLDDNRNVLPPVTLIEAAESYGRMMQVDRWVLRNLLDWLEQNPSVLEKVEGFSVNLSGSSMNDDQFLDYVLGELSATSVPRSKISFEVTETATISNLSSATEFIQVLRRSGCKFSLDDFGTGLSSYAYIQRLPVDYIKIDGVFIRNILHNPKDQALVRSINELAHFMNIETVAEFVENENIANFLRRMGVDYGQGYGLSRPLPLVELPSNLPT